MAVGGRNVAVGGRNVAVRGRNVAVGGQPVATSGQQAAHQWLLVGYLLVDLKPQTLCEDRLMANGFERNLSLIWLVHEWQVDCLTVRIHMNIDWWWFHH